MTLMRAIRRVLNEIAAARPISDEGRPIAPRRDAQLSAEGARHMALVRETSALGRLGRRLTCREEVPGQSNPPLDQVGVRGCTDLTDEATQELEAAHARKGSQLGE